MKHSSNITHPELLAPAGKLSVFRAVIEAGADAVYMAGKQFNMRRHRSDFNFTMTELETATHEAHAAGKRVYVTVNSLVGQTEIASLTYYLKALEAIAVDAFIVQDLAVVKICHDQQIHVPLHASTMMNVSGSDTARQLQTWGFSRLVTSRDITLYQAQQIKQLTGLEIEYFLHGDMCSVLSGQCLASGMIFGKSGNRGQCMKPCRWAYDLVSNGSGKIIKENAFLLASKDLCLLQHIPQLVDAGIDSLKIEGRMRPAETLVPIVQAYRNAIDRCLNEPMAASKRYDEARKQQQARARDITTGFAFKHPDNTFIDESGEREPVIFSRHGRMRSAERISLTPEACPVSPQPNVGNSLQAMPMPEISVVVGTGAGAQAALDAGCNHLILNWEADLTAESGWTLSEIDQITEIATRNKTRVLLSTPRVLDERTATELRQFVRTNIPISGFTISTLGALQITPPSHYELWADAALNTLNAKAAAWLLDQGISRIMPAPEASLESILQLTDALPDVPLDLLAHGPLTGMLIEHCLIAMNIQHASKCDFCPMPCALDNFTMVDKAGNRRAIRVDRYCRNHLMMERDIATLPYLDSLLSVNPKSLRINAAIYPPETITNVIGFYHEWLHTPAKRNALGSAFNVQYPPSNHTLGAYPLGICRDDQISRINLKRKERNADNE